MTDWFVGLGSNLGDREALLCSALGELAAAPGLRLCAVSRFHETAPVGGPPQGPFLNAVARLAWAGGPEALLDLLLAVEARHGRRRGLRWGPRTLDLDLLCSLPAVTVHRPPRLVLPHPRLEERRFVLEPLAELAPGLRLPSGRSVGERLGELRSHGAPA